ncbi:MAG TPA: TolC family protein [Terriglobales bacterium]|nr:TolC family protein [Terriglobales bacterium]
MKAKHLFLVFLMYVVACPAILLAQRQPASPPDTGAPLLTLEDAVSLALTNNRLVKNSALEAQKFDFRVATARSRRLPQFQFAVLGGELMHSFDFTFPAGAFGTDANGRPIPSTESKIRNPARFTTYITSAFDQPITQQYKIGLAIRATELGRQIAGEDVRAERQKIAAEVRTAYFDLVATQAGVEAAREAVKTLEEAQRITTRYIAEKTVLRGDALEVDARLAKGRYELSVAENGLATQCEHLNQLLGRDLGTRFRVDSMPEEAATDLTLDAARDKASQNRPEVRQALLKEKQAEYDRRIAKAEYIPDLSLSVRYQGLNNVRVLPENVATAGFYLTWEPFDWGRRRNNVAEKAKTVEQARNGARETESQIAVEVGAKYRKLQEAALLLKAARTGHEAATEQFRVTNNKYKEQAALIKDLLQAQARSTETEFQYEQALSSYWGSLAELRRAMGDE